MVLGSFYGYQEHESRIQHRIKQEFARRFVPNFPYGPSIGDSIIELRAAFVDGKVIENPYYNTKEYLTKIVQEGKESGKKIC